MKEPASALENLSKHHNVLIRRRGIIRLTIFSCWVCWARGDRLVLFRTLLPHATLEIHLESVLFVILSTIEPQLALDIGGIQDKLDRIIDPIVRRLFRYLPPPFFDLLEIREVHARQVRSHNTTKLGTICDSQLQSVEDRGYQTYRLSSSSAIVQYGNWR
jgi:hypothetical protein